MSCDCSKGVHALCLVTPIFGLGNSVFLVVFDAYEAENGHVGHPGVAGAWYLLGVGGDHQHVDHIGHVPCGNFCVHHVQFIGIAITQQNSN